MRILQRRELIRLFGGAVATASLWPLAVRAQQTSLPVIGFLHQASAEPNASQVAAFKQGLKQTGYSEGQNVKIEFVWADGDYDRLPALAADLVRRQVSLIAVGLLPAALAAKAATNTIPVVFVSGSDAVDAGLVGSLGWPGGNLTGISMLSSALNAKRLELLREVVPATRLIAVLVNPRNPNVDSALKEIEAAARTVGQQIHVERAANEQEFEAAFAMMRQQRADALLVGNDAFFSSRRDQLAALAARYRMPAIYPSRNPARDDGALMSYGADQTDVFRLAGAYAGRILKGEKPADLPVMQPTKFELVISMKAAKALGLTIPLPLLASADEVIE
jgi:putative ABC transport system substrate-binding protein